MIHWGLVSGPLTIDRVIGDWAIPAVLNHPIVNHSIARSNDAIDQSANPH